VVVVIAALFLKREPGQTKPVEAGIKTPIRAAKTEGEGLSLKKAARTRQFWSVFFIFLCYGWTMGFILVHIVPHLTDIGISALIAAAILSTLNGVSIVGRTVFAGMGDRIGNQRAFLVVFIMSVAAIILLLFTRELSLLFLFAVIYGLAYGSGLTQESPLVAQVFGLNSHGLIFGIACFGHMAGAAISQFMGGYIFDITGSYQISFIVCIALSCIGVLLTISLKPVKSNRKAET
jgi:MFS family permease